MHNSVRIVSECRIGEGREGKGFSLSSLKHLRLLIEISLEEFLGRVPENGVAFEEYVTSEVITSDYHCTKDNRLELTHEIPLLTEERRDVVEIYKPERAGVFAEAVSERGITEYIVVYGGLENSFYSCSGCNHVTPSLEYYLYQGKVPPVLEPLWVVAGCEDHHMEKHFRVAVVFQLP